MLRRSEGKRVITRRGRVANMRASSRGSDVVIDVRCGRAACRAAASFFYHNRHQREYTQQEKSGERGRGQQVPRGFDAAQRGAEVGEDEAARDDADERGRDVGTGGHGRDGGHEIHQPEREQRYQAQEQQVIERVLLKAADEPIDARAVAAETIASEPTQRPNSSPSASERMLARGTLNATAPA